MAGEEPPVIPISIHAPREGSDAVSSRMMLALRDFYPRSPRGERRVNLMQGLAIGIFLSTLPARGATVDARPANTDPSISIHAPREGSDQQAVQAAQAEAEFLSTLPARGATQLIALDARHAHISIHAPREGSDSKCAEK